jgi:hypothetical protein
MTESRNADGTFAPAELSTGLAAVEEAQGYTAMPEPEDRPEPVSDIKQEAERLAASRAPEDPVIEIAYRDGAGDIVDTAQTVSAERAGKDLNVYHAALNDVAKATGDADVSRFVDTIRAEALAENPEIAKDLGLSKEEVAAAKTVEVEAAAPEAPAQQSEPDPYADIPGLEAETNEWLKKAPPQGKQFLEQNAAETDRAVETFKAGVTQAQTFGQGAMLALAPELAQVPLDRWGEGIQILAQADPARGQQLARMFQNVAALNERQQLVEHYQNDQRRTQFETYRAQQNAIINKAVPMTHAAKAEFADDLLNYVADFGVTRENLVQAMESNPLMHHAAFQMAYDAVRYNKMMKAPKPTPTRNAVPLTRPGTATHRPAGDNSTSIRALERQLESATGHRAARLGAKLLAAKRA